MQKLISSLAKMLDLALTLGHFMIQNLAQLMVQVTVTGIRYPLSYACYQDWKKRRNQTISQG